MTETKAFSISLDSEEQYKRLLTGPPQNHCFHSGLVTLSPGASVGTHNTEDYEEMVVVLEGQGEMLGAEGRIVINPRQAVYCPPHTEHDVLNTGNAPLKYIYIVTKTV
ncbi:MAG: cupin domain-containing protein [Candidatus Edwardsbacteria bacterium]|nr:cupin domain-containing protein [Candidatus Edwardsbacteria bacterium]MBU1576036.1 cupin domain-containing protein [Candidatus Edwardsbacteria bacterium]MBU2463059.1 cupin domain-containing protein [Candidatus Edwardsbacteria bacterium]MBU2594305.1 cupin domain-containing protein [Candidatus Edwardsbacteria bacterium]